MKQKIDENKAQLIDEKNLELKYFKALKESRNKEYSKAENSWIAVLRISERIFLRTNTIHLTVGPSYIELALACMMTEKYYDGMCYYNQLIQLLPRIELSLCSVSVVYLNLGMALVRLNQFDRIEEYFKYALALGIAHYGKTHRRIAEICQKISHLFRESKMIDRSNFYSKFYENLNETKNVERFLYLADYEVIFASYYIFIEKFDHAVTVYLRALTNYNQYDESYRKYNVISKVIIKILNQLGVMHFKLANYPFALEYHQRALKLQRIPFGKDNLDTARTHYLLGLTYVELHDNKRAIESYKNAIEILKFFGDDQHKPWLEFYQDQLQEISSLEDEQKISQEHYQTQLQEINPLEDEQKISTVSYYPNFSLSKFSLNGWLEFFKYSKKGYHKLEEKTFNPKKNP